MVIDRSELAGVVKAGKLTEPNAVHSTLTQLAFAGLYLGGLALAAALDHPVGWIGFWLLGAVVVLSGFATMHEAIHGSLYRSAWANHVSGIVWGLLMMWPYAGYRVAHHHHHVYAHRDNDSEILDPAPSFPLYVAYLLGGILVSGPVLAFHLLGQLVGRPVAKGRRTVRVSVAYANAAVIVAIVTLLALTVDGFGQLAAWWLIPVVLGSVLIGFVTVPEHHGLTLNVNDPLVNTRTTHSNRLLRRVQWNGNYHTGHHLFPKVTGRNLPHLQAAIQPHLVNEASSYIAFHLGLTRSLLGGGRSGSNDAAELAIDLTQRDYLDRAGARD